MRPVSRPVLVVWLLVSALSAVPYLRAALEPPPGREFVGAFHWIDDFYHYASYVQQSEDGRFLFENKLVLEDHDRVFVNLEWWIVGKVSWLVGRHPFVAFRLLALVAFAGSLSALGRSLRDAGLPSTHRFAGLLLVSIGGGLGGLLFEFTSRSAFRSVDMSVGLFPFLEVLANPHWLAGTWLLLESILAFAHARSWGQMLPPSCSAQCSDWCAPTTSSSSSSCTRSPSR